MKAILSGYNIDRELLSSCDKKVRHLLTPEVFPSAYAKISRSAKSIPELRKEALENIEKARNLNKKIIFDFGHSSVAEHAVFNIDILEISRLAVEYLESVKYASFTEKSQRYVTFGKDFYIPPAIKDTSIEKYVEEGFQNSYDNYKGIIADLFNRKKNEYPPEEHRDLMQNIKEDARYILPLCTKTQVGITINARALEYLISFLCSQGLDELNELSEKLLNITKDVAPSVIKYTDPDNAYCYYSARKPADKDRLSGDIEFRLEFNPIIEYIKIPPDLDNKILALFKFRNSDMPYSSSYRWAKNLAGDEKKLVFMDIFRDMDFFHTMPKEFEGECIDFEAIVSASCFAQLKRHREATIIAQDYSYLNPVILPSVFQESGYSKDLFIKTLQIFRDIYHRVDEYCPEYKNYFLINANSRRVFCQFNIKSLYNFFRLRSDKHAQWEIRRLSDEILERLRAGNFISLGLACGKDRFQYTKEQLLKIKGDSIYYAKD